MSLGGGGVQVVAQQQGDVVIVQLQWAEAGMCACACACGCVDVDVCVCVCVSRWQDSSRVMRLL